jgi:hypothetical protein
MEKVRRVAYLSVGRAVGFAGLAILTAMVGLSFDPLIALRCGGLLLLLLMSALLLKAQRAPFANHRRTEAWLLLDVPDRPDERYARFVVTTALREAYLRFARWTAGVAVLVWTIAVLCGLAGLAGRAT